MLKEITFFGNSGKMIKSCVRIRKSVCDSILGAGQQRGKLMALRREKLGATDSTTGRTVH